VSTTQAPSEQRPETQSPPEPHRLPTAHPSHVPPQSSSVSGPFLTLSEQDGAAQTSGVPSQTPLAQSKAAVQDLPFAQGAQGPPQSESVSLPFFTPSSQADGVQAF